MERAISACPLCDTLLMGEDKEGVQSHLEEKHNSTKGLNIICNLLQLQQASLELTINFLSELFLKLSPAGDPCPEPVQKTLQIFLNISKRYLDNGFVSELKSVTGKVPAQEGSQQILLAKRETKTLKTKTKTDPEKLLEVKTEIDNPEDEHEQQHVLSSFVDVSDVAVHLKEECLPNVETETEKPKMPKKRRYPEGTFQQFTAEQRKFCVDLHKELSGGDFWYERLCERFRSEFPTMKVPNRTSIILMKNKFDKFQTVENQLKSGRPKVPLSLVCEKCGYSGKTAAAMRAHKRDHHMPKWECPVCRRLYAFGQKAIHEQSHLPESEKRYKCSQCGRGFNTNKHLDQHFNSVHSDERPHICQFQCGYACKLDSNLWKHEKICQKKT